MKFNLFESVKGKVKGALCTWTLFCSMIDSPKVAQIAKAVAAGRGELKSSLPAVTWQALFPDGERKSDKAVPSGLFMLDIDHLAEEPGRVYEERVAGHLAELGIRIVHKTVSCHGLRVVANCRPEFSSIEQNQRWLAEKLGLEYDGVCKDWARASFLVPGSYFYYLDAKVFDPEEPLPQLVWAEAVEQRHTPRLTAYPSQEGTDGAVGEAQALPATVQEDFKGLPLKEIAMAWLNRNGGVPQEGERNAQLFKLATRLRYITDFNAAAIASALPDCGLGDAEVKAICASAVQTQRAVEMPRDMREVVEDMMRKKEEIEGHTPPFGHPSQEGTGLEEEGYIDTSATPPLPPIFKQYYDAAPDDFKQAAVLCLLPILGTLGSRLRGEYMNHKVESPSFMVSLEAPQASGKSFIEAMSDRCLRQLKKKDEQGHLMERMYAEADRQAKLGSTKTERQQLKKEREERVQPIIRKMPATASITKLLIRMENAQGLHLFALAVEIDTVYKAFKRGFSNLSDLLRCAFDNSEYGQDYATDTSYSGTLPIYYNTLYSGTPKAMRRFYPDCEDGTMSRTLFVTLPDQFGKTMPVWRQMSETEEALLDVNLTKLYEVSLQGDEVQPEHVMELGFLNKKLEAWMEKQRQLTLKSGDRTRNTFYRRCAEVGFRAGMLAHFLYNEADNNATRSKVGRFAIWVAEMMLKEFVVRVRLDEDTANSFIASAVYNALPSEFSREELEGKLREYRYRTPLRRIVCSWKQQGLLVNDMERGATLFKKNGDVKCEM